MARPVGGGTTATLAVANGTSSGSGSSSGSSSGSAAGSNNESSLRLEFYPPFVAPPPAGVTRCGEHTDCGTLSILAQDSEGGLEVS